jgi:hypothetical protein
VVDGDYVPSGELPTPSDDDNVVVIAELTAPGDLVNGGTSSFELTVDDPAKLADVVQVLIKIDGVDGYFTVPATIVGDKLIFDIAVDQDYFVTDDKAVGKKLRAAQMGNLLNFIIQLVDRNGNASGRINRATNITQVGAGTLQVSLSWNSPSDVDLHLVEPNGEEIYYGHKTSASGGVLDLDSNAGCNIDGVNNENITWTDPSVPPDGEYIVRVDYWSACEEQSASYTVTVNNCGQRQTFNGSFAPGDADGGSSGSGVEVSRFDFVSCNDFKVSGKATYEDFQQTTSGLSSTSTILPIKHAKIEVKRKTDDVTLASGKTDANGKYDIAFKNTGDKTYYVVVIAEQDNATVKQKVVNDSGDIYSKKSDDVDGAQNQQKLDLNIEAKKATAGPAFNIFDVGVAGAATVRTYFGKTPPMLTWLWTSGKKGSCSGNVSCYSNSQVKISVLSLASDPDEYDDLVLLHEYGHFFQYKYSRSDSPGGAHSSKNRIDPRLAWGEGSATAFATISKKTSTYIDTDASSTPMAYDLEQPPANRPPLGTDDGKIDGKLSEALVAAIMWDLHDSTNETNGANKPKDTVSNTTGVFNALGYLKSSKFSDRGHTGADLTDFLDGWFCLGNKSRGDANTGVEGIVNGMFEFPYDYPTLTSCK